MIVRVAVVVRVRPPLTPVIVRLYVLLAVLDSVATVSVEVVDPAGVGENVTVDPAGWPARLNVTCPLKPLVGAIATVYVAVLPRWMDCPVGVTESVKSAGALVTVTLAVPNAEPLVAVTVKGPPAVAPAVNRPLAEMVPPPLLDQLNSGCGDMGWPNWSRAVAVNCCVPPDCTDALAGVTVIDVSTGADVVHDGNLNEAIRVLQLNAPVDFRYSEVNQNVQSSVGSTVMEL